MRPACSTATGSRCGPGPAVDRPSSHRSQTAARRIRDSLIASGVLRVDADAVVLTRDHPFDSPSAAATVLMGRTANGWREWRTADDRPIAALRTPPEDLVEQEFRRRWYEAHHRRFEADTAAYATCRRSVKPTSTTVRPRRWPSSPRSAPLGTSLRSAAPCNPGRSCRTRWRSTGSAVRCSSTSWSNAAMSGASSPTSSSTPSPCRPTTTTRGASCSASSTTSNTSGSAPIRRLGTRRSSPRTSGRCRTTTRGRRLWASAAALPRVPAPAVGSPPRPPIATSSTSPLSGSPIPTSSASSGWRRGGTAPSPSSLDLGARRPLRGSAWTRHCRALATQRRRPRRVVGQHSARSSSTPSPRRRAQPQPAVPPETWTDGDPRADCWAEWRARSDSGPAIASLDHRARCVIGLDPWARSDRLVRRGPPVVECREVSPASSDVDDRGRGTTPTASSADAAGVHLRPAVQPGCLAELDVGRGGRRRCRVAAADRRARAPATGWKRGDRPRPAEPARRRVPRAHRVPDAGRRAGPRRPSSDSPSSSPRTPSPSSTRPSCAGSGPPAGTAAPGRSRVLNTTFRDAIADAAEYDRIIDTHPLPVLGRRATTPTASTRLLDDDGPRTCEGSASRSS